MLRASRRIPTNGYYVYALYREDGVTPFYIGKGGLNRWRSHEGAAKHKRYYKDYIILKMMAAGLTEIPKKKLAEGLTDKEAKILERRLIAQIGRHPNGPLANHTDGGDGVSGITKELLVRRNAAIKAAFSDPDVLIRHGQQVRERQADPAYRRMLGRRVKEAWANDPSIRTRRAETLRKNWTQEKSAALTARVTTPEMLEKRSAGMRAAWQRPETREKFLRRFSPEVIERAKKALAQTMKNPELIAKYSAGGKKGAASRWGKKRKHD